jgi:hypothetical protein
MEHKSRFPKQHKHPNQPASGTSLGIASVVDPSVETEQLSDSCGWLLKTGQQQD